METFEKVRNFFMNSRHVRIQYISCWCVSNLKVNMFLQDFKWKSGIHKLDETILQTIFDWLSEEVNISRRKSFLLHFIWGVQPMHIIFFFSVKCMISALITVIYIHIKIRATKNYGNNSWGAIFFYNFAILDIFSTGEIESKLKW